MGSWSLGEEGKARVLASQMPHPG